MGNAEMQLPTLASILYEDDRSRIGSVHLQSLTDWKNLCPDTCTHCKINGLAHHIAGRNSQDHLDCMGRAYKLLSAIIPHDEREIREVEREEDEESEEEVEEPSEAEMKIREWLGEYGPKCARKVLNALNNVYEP